MVYLISIDYNYLLSVDLAFCESYTCVNIVVDYVQFRIVVGVSRFLFFRCLGGLCYVILAFPGCHKKRSHYIQQRSDPCTD